MLQATPYFATSQVGEKGRLNNIENYRIQEKPQKEEIQIDRWIVEI